MVALASGDRAIKSVTPFMEVSQTSRTNSATRVLRLASAKRSTTKAETTCGSVSPQCAVNRTSSVILKIAIDQPDTDAGFGADIVHARLVKTPFGETNYRRVQDLRFSVETAIGLRQRHWAKTMNERSFIVKWLCF